MCTLDHVFKDTPQIFPPLPSDGKHADVRQVNYRITEENKALNLSETTHSSGDFVQSRFTEMSLYIHL